MLSKELAQIVVDKMMDILPYNVNIMDKKAIIIASGEKERIGNLHLGALEALKVEECIEIYNDEDKEGSKMGVNIPISFNNRIIGVIGVTGHPDKVRNFGSLVKVTSELLINQEYSIQKFIIKDKIKREFLSEWLHKKEKYDMDFIERGLKLSIDVREEYRFALIEVTEEFKDKAKIKSKSFEERFNIVFLSEKRIIFIENKKDSMGLLLKSFENMINRAIITRFKGDLSDVYGNTNMALSIAIKINCKSKIIKDKGDILFLNSLGYSLENGDSNIILKKIKEEGEEILETFIHLASLNFDRANTAKELHIHRNTLLYRVNKIEDKTGLKFDRTVDRLRYTNAYLYYQIFKKA
ncbi:MAG: CdaR family transcriptional regulator [Clostridium sp.]|uniref:CdaR family transcriptional regulator n=1 Tax=Clostridium sp. TaxID=1506 RepID=UPI003F3E705D